MENHNRPVSKANNQIDASDQKISLIRQCLVESRRTAFNDYCIRRKASAKAWEIPNTGKIKSAKRETMYLCIVAPL
jgi:hypothetical protein